MQASHSPSASVMLKLLPFAIATGLMTGFAAAQDSRPTCQSKPHESIHGLWRGSWGGGETDDGVVYQPVVAELFVAKNLAAWQGLPLKDGKGTVKLAPQSESLRGQFVFANDPSRDRSLPSVPFTYEIAANRLQIRFGEDRQAISLQRIPIDDRPNASLQLSFETARGIDQKGNLLLTTYAAYRVGEEGPEVASPMRRRVSLQQARIYRIEENAVQRTDLETARSLLQAPTSVTIAATSKRSRNPRADFNLFKKYPALLPDSEPGLKTLQQRLRPGTLVFVIPAEQLRVVP